MAVSTHRLLFPTFAQVKAHGPGLEKTGVAVNKPAEFTVDAKNGGKAPLKVQVQVRDPSLVSRRPDALQKAPVGGGGWRAHLLKPSPYMLPSVPFLSGCGRLSRGCLREGQRQRDVQLLLPAQEAGEAHGYGLLGRSQHS